MTPTPPPTHSAVPLLLLPGLMNDRRVWDPVVQALGADRPVVVARTDVHDTVEAMAAAALALAPPGRFAVGGFSLGGYVALDVWRQAPDRVAGLALLDTSARADSEAGRQLRQRMIDGVGGGPDSFDAMASAFLPRVVHPSRLGDAALAHLLREMARAVGAEGYVRQQHAALHRQDRVADLASVRCPTLVLCGRDDQVTPLALSQELAAAIPGAQLAAIPDCGHMSTLEAPGQVAGAMAAWCARVDGAAP